VGDVHSAAGGIEFKPTVVDNLHQIPSGWTVSQPQPVLPEAQTDLLNYSSDYKEFVLSLHGIPSSLLLSGARNNSKTTTNLIDDNDLVVFTRTLRLWGKNLSNLGQEMYLNSFPELNRRSDLKFHIKMTPFSNPSQIQRLFEQSIIHEKAHKETMMAIHGLHSADMAEGENNISRPPLNGNENQTTDIINAKKRIMESEVELNHAKAKQLRADGNEEGKKVKMEEELMQMKLDFEREKNQMELEFLREKLKLDREKMDMDIKKSREQMKIANKKKPVKSAAAS
jgi:hypothetical protein